MVIELKSEQLRVQFNSFGGALSSIKDAEGLEYLWQGDATYWSGQAPVLFPHLWFIERGYSPLYR